ncbi:MAG: helix-turn-helix transcriptional regulator [Cyclobacteriaceae bacterium]
MKEHLGELEELVLLTIAYLGDEAYGVNILEELKTKSKRKLTIGGLHSTMTRLEEKGLLVSYMGEPTKSRGGRRKRYFELTDSAKVALNQSKSLRDQLWSLSKVNLSIQ